MVGNQIVAQYTLRIGQRIPSATVVTDAKHSWRDTMSCADARRAHRRGLRAALGRPGRRPLTVTVFLCPVGCQVTTDITRRLLGGIDAGALTAAEQADAVPAAIGQAHVSSPSPSRQATP